MHGVKMKEVRFHGRGGQGAVTSSQVLAIAGFLDGKFTQSFPMFGVERTGAPVQSFTRICNENINVRAQVYEPDYVMVLDPTLMEVINPTQGLKKGGMLIVNSHKSPKELGLKGNFTVKTIDVTKAAMEVIGKPFVNLAVLGAFSALTGEVSWNSLEKAILEKMSSKGKLAELNAKAARKVFEDAGGK